MTHNNDSDQLDDSTRSNYSYMKTFYPTTPTQQNLNRTFTACGKC